MTKSPFELLAEESAAGTLTIQRFAELEARVLEHPLWREFAPVLSQYVSLSWGVHELQQARMQAQAEPPPQG
jgi:hypothetical protein